MIRRPPRSTQSRSSAASDVYKRQIQRRHQKLIEIAPSPSLNQDLKKRMIDASLALGKKIKYEGLATIEFLVNVEKEDFRFIECNPRLQVEHTVTESITSLDLVKLQIQIASGKSLTQLKLNQDQIKEPRGFACLLYTSPSPRDGLLSRMPSSA